MNSAKLKIVCERERKGWEGGDGRREESKREDRGEERVKWRDREGDGQTEVEEEWRRA